MEIRNTIPGIVPQGTKIDSFTVPNIQRGKLRICVFLIPLLAGVTCKPSLQPSFFRIKRDETKGTLFLEALGLELDYQVLITWEKMPKTLFYS